MEYKDYYKILGVDRSVDAPEIKKAFRKLARKYHPDVSKEANATEKFQEVQEAYEVLKDPEKRQAYDSLGANWKQGQQFHRPEDWQQSTHFGGGNFTGAEAHDFSDFFADLFGGQFQAGMNRRRGFQMRGEDIHSEITISLEDAFHGAEKLLQMQVPQMNQQGMVSYQPKTIKVKIPQGVANGQQLRLKGQGAPGMGEGPAGDLYLKINITPHNMYMIDGRDIHLKLPVAPWEAALGAEIQVPTLSGKISVKIPAGSQSGKKLRIKGKGLPGKTPGDLYISLQINIPEASTEEQKEIYKKMQQQMPFNPRADLGV